MRSIRPKLNDCLSEPLKRRDYNQRLFTVVAPKYDIATRLLSFGQDSRWKRILIENLPSMEAPRCLDIACGSGDLSLELALRFPRGYVVGIDLTPAMIERARERNSYSNVEFAIEDMCHMGLIATESIDIVTGGYALRNAQNLDELLGEIRRVLRPGGAAAFLEFSKAHNKLMRFAHRLILETWAALCGIVLHGSADVYRYIPKTLRGFPESDQLRHRIESYGFDHIRSFRFSCGILELTFWQKRA